MRDLPPIVGLSGYARSGKDSVADYLAREYGYRRVAFGDHLKKFVTAVFPDVAERVDQLGWEKAKEILEVRRALQRVGSAGRDHIHPDVWIISALRELDDEATLIVVSDVRFPNEATLIQNQGGPVWRLERQGYGPAGNDITDTSLDDYEGFAATINNDGDLESLYAKVEAALDLWTANARV
jgi:hypothetical protein